MSKFITLNQNKEEILGTLKSAFKKYDTDIVWLTLFLNNNMDSSYPVYNTDDLTGERISKILTDSFRDIAYFNNCYLTLEYKKNCKRDI